eukprot:TRINITY_DN60943_c0_g1_i1.p1 TRINITY_DN60943_c0_g1~~TRINITY_DN60943_c0_g1_i1.p1  ORF type:complete len:907 (+),score=189.03 TRINITY_DN60943_c0_g1_i1:41-2722(+)
MAKFPRIIAHVVRTCKAVGRWYKDNPTIFLTAIVAVLLLILLIMLFSISLSRITGTRGAIAVDLILFWLFARLVARVLMFPGSLKLFQRSTEANFRSELARQYVTYIRQLWTFLRHAAKQSESMLQGISPEGIANGCFVVENLSMTLHMQEHQHEVHLNAEQKQVREVAQDVERWLASAKVRNSAEGQAMLPLKDWLRQSSSATYGMSKSSRYHALSCAELVGDTEAAARSIAKLEKLMAIMDDLWHPKPGMLGTAMRFLKVPTVGSLDQLRAELQMRFSGQHCWVRTSGGHRLDAMFIPCSFDQLDEAKQASPESEQVPLKGQASFSGAPTLIWCNPNAAYYETMLYQASILNFWLSRGCNLFLFNYAGYGRSSGKPSPARVTEDSEAVVNFLRSRGVKKMGVYGRSIGGVSACHLARRFPEVVQLLITDRTMSTLGDAARYMYGSWAAKGLRATSMVADNVDNFWEVRCHKLLICDPKDTMILDLAALRTGVALRFLEHLAPEERLSLDDTAMLNLREAWSFFETIFTICEEEEDVGGFEYRRSSAQQIGLADSMRPDVRMKTAESAETPSATRGGGLGGSSGGGGSSGSTSVPGGTLSSSAGDRVNSQWLEDNAGLVRSVMAPQADQLHSLLDMVGAGLEGGGMTLSDVFLEYPGNACWALRCMLANLQVWGTLGDPHAEDPDPAFGELAEDMSSSEKEVEEFVSRAHMRFGDTHRVSPERLAELAQTLQPETIGKYHRRLARARVALLRREFRRRQSTLQAALENASTQWSASGNEDLVDRLLRTVMQNLTEVEGFVSTLARFFKSVDLALPSGASGIPEDSADEPPAASTARISEVVLEPRPAIDRSSTGYIMHVDCGHNGPLDEVDLRQLSVHLRAAGFGPSPRIEV